jgi:two-component system chemotaxis sensor kinase CheA
MDAKEREFQKRLLATFAVEAAEHVQTLSSGLIKLEQAASTEQRRELIEIVFREAHSLKGAARAVGVSSTEMICQGLESVFSDLKRKALDCPPALFDVLHEAVDALGKVLSASESEPAGGAKLSISELLRRLDGALEGIAATQSGARTQEQAGAKPPPRPDDRPTLPDEKIALADTVRMRTARLDALLFQAEGLLAAKLSTAQHAVEIREAIGALGTLEKERAKLGSGVKAIGHAVTRASRDASSGDAHPQLRKLAEFISWESGFIKAFEAKIAAIATAAERDQRSLAAMVDGLLEDTKKALMLPMSSILEVLPKLARGLSRAQGKEVELVMRGGEIELDRRILDQMRDPLIHLVRNCVDHGIEMPAVRTGKGKPASGTITFAISQKNGSRIEILVGDDGAGIDLAKVEAAARELGVVPTDEARSKDPQQLLSLVFHSGVSSSPIITDISGRGLGLAIVREKVEKLGGDISVDTQPGRGTTFRILLPLTLATFRGVRVRVRDHQFLVPTAHVQQAVRVDLDAIKTVENRETVQWSGQTIALVRLADTLELPQRASSIDTDAGKLQILILGSADKRIAFCVDEIIEEQEVLVKPLGRQLSRVRNIAGAAVLGTGKAVPILDIPDLLKSAVKLAAGQAGSVVGRALDTDAQQTSVLVAEDSITSRTLLKNILESAGYAVTTAIDGADALMRLKADRYDLLVSDVEMPRMNGFDLIARVRAEKALAQMPAVLVTALDSREDRERGIEVGANAYIVKSSFDQSNLLEVIRRLI